ncbi:hypothetical protein LX64_02941 [Chitinophaga skermanii]|uniref:Uncharacterized protein n=1 Tax=Chitinophaga skermanii TaxID=331697 RepID=A0A327QK44_9BACT|nr:hypothetical protein [Chitinophaga skermanii]RAJ04064.1 hypothetical protein LX64_02941 [Chitinophaga skermanii]
MKHKYYVNDNTQKNGDHEVHVNGCYFLKVITNKSYLGEFDTCQEAVRVAKKLYVQSNGCAYCSEACHTT